MDRSRHTWGCMDCTTPALPRSSVPFRPVQFHRILAFHSPPSTTAHQHALLTTRQTSGLVLCPRHDLARVRTRAHAASPGAASGRSGPHAQARPATRRSHMVLAPIQEAPLRSTPRRARSSDLGLVVLFHRILAFHSPPSVVNRMLNVSLCPSRRAECALATWPTARSPTPGGSGNSSAGWDGYR